MIVIRGGEALAPGGWVTADVSIDADRVAGVGSGLSGNVEIDAVGCLVGPGFVDMHTHLREPGQTWKEDIASASRAAVAGGFTAITAMPNTDPPMDSPKVVESVLSSARQIGLVEVLAAGSLTEGRAGAVPNDIEGLYRVGVRLFTDDGDSVADRAVLEAVMKQIAALPGAVLAQHAEDSSLTEGGQMHEGVMSRRLGIEGMPSRAETDVVARDLELAARTGVHYHCQHVSASQTVELIRDAKKAGLAVTAEVTPHHLSFDDSFLAGLDADFKMYPPLRGDGDRLALIEGLRSEVIDVVATDHAPHLREEKQVAFRDAPRGVIGLETAAAATWMALEDRDRFFSSLSTRPAEILGLGHQGRAIRPGAPANLVVFDPSAEWVADRFRSKSSNSPHQGRKMKGQVRATVHGGEVVYHSEEDER